MKINSIETYNYIGKINSQNRKTQQINNISRGQTNPIVAYPQNYYVSFKARDLVADFNTFKDTEMPTTVKNYIENEKLLSSEAEFKALISRGLKEAQRAAFSDLASCKTVEDIKAQYPNEEDFKKLKSLSEINTKSEFFSAMKQMEAKGIKTLSCEEDVTTFLVKKLYLECKKYKDVIEDLNSAITPEAKELKNVLAEYTHARATFFVPLGIKVPNGVTYGSALQGSDPNGAKERKPFKNLTPEQVTEKIQKLLTQGEKSRYSMMDAWNNCEDIRFDLSRFLTENYNNPTFFSFYDEKGIDIFDSKFYSKQRNLMIGFWEKYPQHKETLGKEIKIALERFDKYKGMDAEKFEEYKKSIEDRSQQIRNNIQFSKIDVEKDFPNAIEIINMISNNANPMSIKSDSANADFAKLLLKQTSIKELQILQSDENSIEYKKLIPDGMKEKMRSLLKTPEYANLSNAQNIAVLQNLIEEMALSENDINSIISSKKPLTEIIKEIISGQSDFVKGHSIYLESIEERYNSNKQPLNSNEVAKVREELLKFNPSFKEEDNLKLDMLLTTQGKYLKTVVGQNYLKPLTQILFWNEFDRINGTNYSTIVLNNIKLDKTIEDAINIIDNMDFSGIENLDW
ncbi:MAG: hypothetical protein IJY61_04120 [Candidatus Gastranaerophilales bacterium]|nr:hypothetical protein [Candidatus Gastranaerophilales bacterium]